MTVADAVRRKPRFVRLGFGDRRTGLAEAAAIFAIAASGLMTSVLVALDDRSVWAAAPATVLIAYGIITTTRIATIVGFGLSAIGAIVATSGIDPATAMLVNAPAAVILVALLPAIDLAFTSRRETVMHPSLVPAMVRVYTVAAVAGSAWTLTVASLVVLVDWPDVAITAAMGTLAAATALVAITLLRAANNRGRT